MSTKRIILALAAAIAVVGSGVVHGWITERWSDSAGANQAAIARLKQLPDRFGDWELDDEFEIDRRQLQIGEIDGYISRRYVDRAQGAAVNVIIVCGRPGAIAVHTPDVCFRGQGLRQVHAQEQESMMTAAADAGECWHADFIKPNAPASSGLRVFWTWTADGKWTAPSYPRVEFAGKHLLYKMYVTHALNSAAGDDDRDDPARRFMAAWFPVVNRVLFGDSDDSTAEIQPSPQPHPSASD